MTHADSVASQVRVEPSGATRSQQGSAAVVLGVIVAIGLAAGAWPVILSEQSPVPFAVAPFVAHLCGMLAGYGVLVMMVLMSRWPVLERGVGSDRLARWHSRGGRIVLTLIVVHAWSAVHAWAGPRQESLTGALLDVMGMPWLICAAISTALLIAVAVVSVRQARRRLRYETWHGIHLWVYVAIALSFLHQLGGPDLAGRTPLQIAWALLYTHAFALVLRHRVVRPMQMAGRNRLRVHAVIPESPDTVSVVFSGRHLSELGALSGQFFRWRFLTPDTWSTAHPFSLSAAPRDDFLRITIKTLGDGSGLLQHIDVGTWVIAEGPYGVMTPRRRTRRNVLLIAGGVGITPMRALFESMPTNPGDDILLLYRARDPEALVFQAELDGIARVRGVRVGYLLGPSRDQLSARALLEMVPDLAERDVYLCGPPGMSDATRRSLFDAGLSPAQLHEERFAM